MILSLLKLDRNLSESKPDCRFGIAADWDFSVKHLGTALNGAVDSPINGGVKLYRDTFLDNTYIRNHPDEVLQLQDFKLVYEDYVRTVHTGLQLHGKVCKDIAFHEALKNRTSLLN